MIEQIERARELGRQQAEHLRLLRDAADAPDGWPALLGAVLAGLERQDALLRAALAGVEVNRGFAEQLEGLLASCAAVARTCAERLRKAGEAPPPGVPGVGELAEIIDRHAGYAIHVG